MMRRYLILGCIYIAVWFILWKAEKLRLLGAILSFVGIAFLFAWMIVGAVSLWRDGADCIGLNYDVWAVAMADVIVTIVLVCTSWFWLPDFVRERASACALCVCVCVCVCAFLCV